ncbi:MAG TPA: NAD(P)H-hydrate dehydratase [Patescibacteria group bacterium]|jgi:NAD(P)H-hydrate epimerase
MKLTERPENLAKGDWGKLLVLAGSARFAGAAVHVTSGALRTGVDLVVAAAPARAADAILVARPDTVTIRLEGTEFEKGHLEDVSPFRGYPVAIGSGLTLEGSSRRFLEGVLKEFSGPMVIDADALRLLAEERKPEKLLVDRRVVLTPNREEYGLLEGDPKADVKKTIRELAKGYGATILAKGPTDYVSDGKTLVEIEGGSPFLAKAGTGDVLTGIVGALLARGLEPLEAAKVGAAALKDASERAGEDKGPSLLAADLPEYLDLRQLP